MPTWDDDPFGAHDLVVMHRLIDGPVPGSPEGREVGCVCPGDVGDVDKWGRPGGITVDNDCPLHGKKARRDHDRKARESWLKSMRALEDEERSMSVEEQYGNYLAGCWEAAL